MTIHAPRNVAFISRTDGTVDPDWMAVNSTDYSASISDVLKNVGSREGSLASGAATALALSLAVECLALASTLSDRRPATPESADYHDALRSRLDRWRSDSARAFVEDPSLFKRVLAARAARAAAAAGQRASHVDEELNALVEATRILVELLGLSLDVDEEARVMIGSHCAVHARGEAATAKALARAATEAVLVMAGSNIATMSRRLAEYGDREVPLDSLRECIDDLPEGAARTALTNSLSEL